MSKSDEQAKQCRAELDVQRKELREAKAAYQKKAAEEAANPIKAFFSSIFNPSSGDLARVVEQEKEELRDKKLECGTKDVIADPGKALKRMLRGGRD